MWSYSKYFVASTNFLLCMHQQHDDEGGFSWVGSALCLSQCLGFYHWMLLILAPIIFALTMRNAEKQHSGFGWRGRCSRGCQYIFPGQKCDQITGRSTHMIQTTSNRLNFFNLMVLFLLCMQCILPERPPCCRRLSCVLSSVPMTLSLYYFVPFCPSALTPCAYLNSGHKSPSFWPCLVLYRGQEAYCKVFCWNVSILSDHITADQ